jgi:hypothetical protein
MATNNIVSQVVAVAASQPSVDSKVSQVVAVVASQPDVDSVVSQMVMVVASHIEHGLGWQRGVERGLTNGVGSRVQ